MALASLLLLGACATSGQDPQPDQPDAVKLTYQGPKVEAVLRQDAHLHQVSVRVQVPTGGYELRLDETRSTGQVTAVYLTLVGPGPDEAVTMALEEPRANVSLPPGQSAVYVYVKQVQRDVEYGHEPPAELAQVLAR
jgi:hypothetical protein